MHVQIQQFADMRGVTREPILHDNQMEMGVLVPYLPQQTFGSFSLAVVLRIPILLLNGLGGQGNHLPMVRVHEHRCQHLVLIRNLARLFIHLFQTGGAMDGRGREIPRAIQRE